MWLIAIRLKFNQKNKISNKKRLRRLVIIQIKGQIAHLSIKTATYKD
jgi:hypothetical protein